MIRYRKPNNDTKASLKIALEENPERICKYLLYNYFSFCLFEYILYMKTRHLDYAEIYRRRGINIIQTKISPPLDNTGSTVST